MPAAALSLCCQQACLCGLMISLMQYALGLTLSVALACDSASQIVPATALQGPSRTYQEGSPCLLCSRKNMHNKQ